MKTVNFSAIFVTYNFIIGVLVMIASEKLGVYAGHMVRSHRAQAARLTRVVTFTFGCCVAILAAGIYLAAYLLKL
jgi:hypothetical protein